MNNIFLRLFKTDLNDIIVCENCVDIIGNESVREVNSYHECQRCGYKNE